MLNHLSAPRRLALEQNTACRSVRHNRPALYDGLVGRVDGYVVRRHLEPVARHELYVFGLDLESPGARHVDVAVFIYRDGPAAARTSDGYLHISALVHLHFGFADLHHMNTGRRFAGIAPELVGDFLVFAPRHGRALRRADDDRKILIAVYKLANNDRAHVGIAEYAIAHVISAEKRRDDLGIGEFLRRHLILYRIHAGYKHLEAPRLQMPDNLAPVQPGQLIPALALDYHFPAEDLSVFLICFSTLRLMIFSRISLAAAFLFFITWSTKSEASEFILLELLMIYNFNYF